MSEGGKRHHWKVAAADEKQRLDHFLVDTGELGSRSQIGKLISEGRVRLDGVRAKAGAMLRPGQRIDVEQPPPNVIELRAEPIDIRVLYEDDYLLAVDKPAGLVVHPAPGHWRGTLVNALLYRWQGERPGLDPQRCGIVHRLDKDTSGVILVAKDLQTHEELGRLFRRRAVYKRYTAIVAGIPQPEAGEIDAPIARHKTDRKRMAVRAAGRAAVTRYEVIERYRGAALVHAFPRTGRTHQIRVHLASIGHPVLADPVYASSRRSPLPVMSRQALHAERLKFTHPRTGRELRLRAPWPDDLAAAVEELRLKTSTPRSVDRRPL